MLNSSRCTLFFNTNCNIPRQPNHPSLVPFTYLNNCRLREASSPCLLSLVPSFNITRIIIPRPRPSGRWALSFSYWISQKLFTELKRSLPEKVLKPVRTTDEYFPNRWRICEYICLPTMSILPASRFVYKKRLIWHAPLDKLIPFSVHTWVSLINGARIARKDCIFSGLVFHTNNLLIVIFEFQRLCQNKLRWMEDFSVVLYLNLVNRLWTQRIIMIVWNALNRWRICYNRILSGGEEDWRFVS